jgi:hypothetical protein
LGDQLNWIDKYLERKRRVVKGETFHTAVFSLRVCCEINPKALIRGLINLLTGKNK